MSQALCFNDVSFDVITMNSQPWVRGSQIATALQYSSAQRVIEIYTRHADEFTDAMTSVVILPTEGGPQETRIFSLRGCHLIAMFARTQVAKAFRKWVLDILEKLAEEEAALATSLPELEPAPPSLTPSTVTTRKPLEKLVKVWAVRSGIPHAQCWTMLDSHFCLTGINDLPAEWVPDAIAWVQEKIDAMPKALPPAKLVPSSPEALLDQFDRISNKFLLTTFDIRNELSASLSPAYRPHAKQAERDPLQIAASYSVGAMVTAMGQNIEALRHAFRVVAESAKQKSSQPRFEGNATVSG